MRFPPAMLFVLLGAAVPSGIAAQQQNQSEPSTQQTQEVQPYRGFTPLTCNADAHPINEFSGSLFGNIECDSASGVYVRRLDPTGSAYQVPVIRLSATEQTVRYNMAAVPGATDENYIFTYTVGPEGIVYEVVRMADPDTHRGSLYLIAFASDGTFKWKVQIDDDEHHPAILVSLQNEEFLISGTAERLGVDKKKTYSQFSHVIDRSGKVVRRFGESGDEQKDALGLHVSKDTVEFSLGEARLGDDGNIYVLRASASPRVEIFSPAGKLEKTLTLELPFARAQSFDIYPSGYRLFVKYQRSPQPNEKPDGKVILSAYNAQDGRLMHSYIQESPGILACIQNGEATILAGTKDHRFAIIHEELP